MTFLVYFILYSSCIYLATRTTRTALRHNGNIWNTISVYLLLSSFTFIVGTRYMVGVDYPVYMEIIPMGEHHYYYDHIELIPRKFMDWVNYLKLEYYWWFILMAFFQILFLVKAVRGSLVKVFPWIIFCFFVFYLSFYMNGARQGAALSCFLCAVTYAQERKLWHYLAFFLLAFLCHSSVIVWLPTYWIFNRELFPNIKLQYLLLAISSLFLPYVIEKALVLTRSYWELFGYGYQAENYGGDEADIVLGSGMGMMLRYLRWSIIIAYYERMKNYYGANNFLLPYNLFFIGICFDYSTVFNILLARLFMYGSFMEIVILPYLLHYLWKSKRQLDILMFFFLLLILFVLIIHSITQGDIEWRFVWERYAF